MGVALPFTAVFSEQFHKFGYYFTVFIIQQIVILQQFAGFVVHGNIRMRGFFACRKVFNRNTQGLGYFYSRVQGWGMFTNIQTA
jgi:hypothetical protein